MKVVDNNETTDQVPSARPAITPGQRLLKYRCDVELCAERPTREVFIDWLIPVPGYEVSAVIMSNQLWLCFAHGRAMGNFSPTPHPVNFKVTGARTFDFEEERAEYEKQHHS